MAWSRGAFPAISNEQGRSGADGLVGVLMRFSTLAGDFADLLAEIDVNPLIATGSALVAMNALAGPGKAE